MPDEVLSLSHIVKSYGGVHALRDADFGLYAGEVHALMGENGAGKSTLAKIIAGATHADSGTIAIAGKPVTIRGPLDAQRLGISIIFQELDLFPNLSIAENLVIANNEFVEGCIARFGDMNEFARGFLGEVGLQVAPARRVASLSIGEMQLVMIARALSMRAKVLIMDEPTSSLFHDSVERLFTLVRKLKAAGVAIVYVSHKMDEIYRICDRITVMRDGKTIGTRISNEVASSELISMMVGRPWKAGERNDSRVQDNEILMSLKGLSTRKLRDVSLDLHKGEVLGIAGLVGAGRSELGAALVGLDAWQKGTMMLSGQSFRPSSVADASSHGIRLLAEDRKLDGLMMQMSVLENGTIADLQKFASGGVTRPRLEERAISPLFRKLAVKTSSVAAAVSSLSGGNQQKVLIARCLLASPNVLFLDDPTRGIDVGAKEDVYGTIAELAEQGKGILFVSSELPELLRCCDRIVVMREGRITATLEAGSTNQEEIMAFATNPAAPSGDARWPN